MSFFPNNNTGAASSGGFGTSSTSAPQSGALFGTAAAKPAASGGLFGNTGGGGGGGGGLLGGATTQPATGGFAGFGALGSTTSAQPAQPASTGTAFAGFGAAQASQPAPAGGLFAQTTQPASTGGLGLLGSTQTTQPAAATGGGLFGRVQMNKPAPPTISLFPPSSTGTASAAPAVQAAQTTSSGSTFSLFPTKSSATTPQLAQQPMLGGLSGLGASSTMATGNQTAQGQAKSSVPELKPLFSSLGTAPLGSSQLPQQQVVPGVKIDVSNLKPTTRFFELHEDLQKTIELIDSFIQSQIQLSTQCEVFLPAHGNIVKSIPPDVEYVQNKYDTVTQALDRDTAELRAVKDAVSLDIDEARRAFSAIENLKLPAQYQYSGMWASKGAGAQDESEADNFFTKTDLMPYFEKRSTDLEKRLNKFNEQVLEIEAHLRTVEDSAVAQTEKLLRLRAGRDTSKERVMELAGAMRGFEDAVFRVASKVGESREGVIECTIGSISGNGARAPFHGRLAR